MSSLEEFLLQISARFYEALPQSRLEAIKSLNPHRIYAENVRSIFGTPMWAARFICDLGVRRGIFERRVQALCPDGAVADSADAIEHLKPEVQCWQEVDGDFEKVTFKTKELKKLEYYALVSQVKR